MASQTLWDTKFDAQAITKLSKQFSGEEAWLSITTAAESFWDVARNNLSPHDPEVMRAWHLLVFSVGNFKRQTPITLPRLRHPGSWEAKRGRRPRLITVPLMDGESTKVDVADRETWEALEKSVKGIGVPTTTTLLSALWPSRHIIIDVRDLTAAIGLDFEAASKEELLKESGRKGAFVSWNAYDWLRPRVLDKAKKTGRNPIEIERALYILDARAGAAQKKAWEDKPAASREKDKKTLPWTKTAKDEGYVHYLAQVIDNL